MKIFRKMGEKKKRKIGLKKGDKVQLLWGEEKGKIGTISLVKSYLGKVRINGIGLQTKVLSSNTEKKRVRFFRMFPYCQVKKVEVQEEDINATKE